MSLFVPRFKKCSSVSLRIYTALFEQQCILVTSPAILEAIRDVISRDYIIVYTHTTPEMRRCFLSSLLDLSMLTRGTAKLTKTSRDGDEDLLDMKVYEDTRIIPPHAFVELLEKGKL